MPKFSALSVADLLTPERDAGRVARKVEWVVFVECDDGSWCELDADDFAHAKVLAHNWVDTLGARGCSVRRVRLIDGKCVRGPSAYTYFWQPIGA